MYPVLLPHYVRRGRDVFFLIRRDPVVRLSHDDVPLFEAIDGRRSERDLLRDFPSARQRLSEWTSQRLLTWVPSVGVPRSAPHVLVVEPHMDDALLSVGGALLKMCHHIRISILSAVKWSTHTSYSMQGRSDFADLHRVTAVRLAESRLAARRLGGQHLVCDEYDAPLLPLVRQDQTLDVAAADLLLNESSESMTRREQRWAARILLGIAPDHSKRLYRTMRGALAKMLADELWFPLGVGHFDHVRVRRACLAAVLAEPSIAAGRRDLGTWVTLCGPPTPCGRRGAHALQCDPRLLQGSRQCAGERWRRSPDGSPLVIFDPENSFVHPPSLIGAKYTSHRPSPTSRGRRIRQPACA